MATTTETTFAAALREEQLRRRSDRLARLAILLPQARMALQVAEGLREGVRQAIGSPRTNRAACTPDQASSGPWRNRRRQPGYQTESSACSSQRQSHPCQGSMTQAGRARAPATSNGPSRANKRLASARCVE